MQPERKIGGDTPKNRGRAGLGRPKGAKNKVTKDLRAMILGALADAGGQKYLTEQAKSNPSAFLTLAGKCLPKEIVGEGGSPLFPSRIEVVAVPAKR